MNREQIDDFLNAWLERDWEKASQIIFQILEIKRENVNSMSEEDFRSFILKIESEGLEYLVSKLKEPKLKETVLELVEEFISKEKREKVMQIITKDDSKNEGLKNKVISEEYKQVLDFGDIISLIEIIDDVEFTKENIRNFEHKDTKHSRRIKEILERLKENDDTTNDFIKECIRNKYGLRELHIYNLIKKINEEEFTKECIENWEEYGLGSYIAINLIEESGNLEMAQAFIKKIEEEGNYESYDLETLVRLTNDLDFVEEVIRKSGVQIKVIQALDKKNIKKCICNIQEIKLEKIQTKELILSLVDCERMNFQVEEEELEKYIEDLNDEDIIRACLIRGSNSGLGKKYIEAKLDEYKDEELTKTCILNGISSNLSTQYIERKLDEFKDEELTKTCILNGTSSNLSTQYIERKLDEFKDEELTKTCILNGISSNLSTQYIERKLDEIKDEELTKTCILNGTSSNLSTQYIERKLDEFKDEELTKTCILNRKRIGLKSDYLVKKVKEINDKEFFEVLLENWKELELDGALLCEVIKVSNTELSRKINFEKLEELLTMQDANYIRGHLLDNVILKNMNDENADVDVEAINEEIDKLHEIFLTNTLPDNFKIFEFFRNHKNHDSDNYNFYSDKNEEERDNIIAGDLFRVLLESNNIKMRTFLETLYNGNIVINKENKEELDEAILIKYRDVLYDLLDVTETNEISKTEDYIVDLKNIREYLNLQENDDIGEKILLKYFEKVGLQYKKEEKSLVETLLKHMDAKREEAKRNNSENFILEEGDLIKGTDIKFLEGVLKDGIRAKEFLMAGDVHSDATPLDTDFSEITQENLQKENFRDIINSTYSSIGFGNTYLIIKKKNYENDEVGYEQGGGEKKTRYFRTGLGSTNISAIVTSEWNDEYKYALAKNEFYIPVINKDDGKVLFSYKEYEEIRDKMQGLTHYGITDFKMDSSAYNVNIEETANELRKNAEAKISTEEKRSKVIDLIRRNIGKSLTTEMLEDISSKNLEFIDTGSTR